MTTEQEAFAIAIGALWPYLSRLVVVGGWAHRLFRLRPGATPPAFVPLVTDDADIATPLQLPADQRPINVLLKEAGFVEELAGNEKPPVACYVLKTDAEAFELEFIADRHANESRRDGHRDVTVSVAGVVAQKLRYVSALLVAPWTVTLDESVGYAIPGGPATVQIPNATSYLFQKLIVLPSRLAAGKGAKDVLYMFDTLRLFADSLEELQGLWHVVSPTLSDDARTELGTLQQRYFGADSADEVVSAAVLAKESGRAEPPTPTTIAATCRAGFRAIFRR